jgi:hypothetical protein
MKPVQPKAIRTPKPKVVVRGVPVNKNFESLRRMEAHNPQLKQQRERRKQQLQQDMAKFSVGKFEGVRSWGPEYYTNAMAHAKAEREYDMLDY